MLSNSIPLILMTLACNSDFESPSRVNHLPYFESREFTPRWFDPTNVPQDFHRVPPFSLVNQHNSTINEQMLDDHVTVVNFFFSFCPGICPKLMRSMNHVSTSFADDPSLLLLSHSVTPDHDTVVKLKAYAKKNEITDPRWHLLTGDREQIYQLGRMVYFAEEDLGEVTTTDDFLHTESLILIDTDRHVRGVYNGLNATSVQQLITDIETLKN